MEHEKGPNLVSYAVTQTIRPSIFEPLTEDNKLLFKSALDRLNLLAAHNSIMVLDRSKKDEWEFPGGFYKSSSEDDEQDDLDDTKLRAKMRHVECLECQTAICEGQDGPSTEPALMLLGYGEMESYDDGM